MKTSKHVNPDKAFVAKTRGLLGRQEMELTTLSDDLQKLRVAYELGDEPVQQVCDRFVITKPKLYRIIRSQGWRKRRDRNKSETDEPTKVLPEAQSAPLETLVKLRKIARQYVSDLEGELSKFSSENTTASSSDRERSVRSLRTLLKIIEEIVELENRFTPVADEDNRKEFDIKQRQDLARRIVMGHFLKEFLAQVASF